MNNRLLIAVILASLVVVGALLSRVDRVRLLFVAGGNTRPVVLSVLEETAPVTLVGILVRNPGSIASHSLKGRSFTIAVDATALVADVVAGYEGEVVRLVGEQRHALYFSRSDPEEPTEADVVFATSITPP